MDEEVASAAIIIGLALKKPQKKKKSHKMDKGMAVTTRSPWDLRCSIKRLAFHGGTGL